MPEAVSPAYFAPDTIKANILFRNMRKEKSGLAVVMDEYGGMTGIITINDLVEQLVGDLGDDEEEEEITLIEKLEENVWRVHGSALLEDLAEVTGAALISDEYDTFNGLVFHALERVPKEGVDKELEVNGLHITITKIENHQVETAIVRLKQEA